MITCFFEVINMNIIPCFSQGFQTKGVVSVSQKVTSSSLKNGLIYGCFLKWWYPQIIHFNRVFHYKPSILGYHHFRKHPYLQQQVFANRRSVTMTWILAMASVDPVVEFDKLTYPTGFFLDESTSLQQHNLCTLRIQKAFLFRN